MIIAEANLNFVDWACLAIYFLVVLIVGMYFVKRSSASTSDYFLAGRSLPWWIAGTSMVATMFAADTPLFHTGNVRRFGMDAGWLFFAPGFGIILASALFARLWRRVRVMTEIELFEMRYTGKAARIFRGFNAIYGGVFIAALTMGWVMLAMGVIVESLLGIDRVVGTWIFLGIVVLYSVYHPYDNASSYIATMFSGAVSGCVACVGARTKPPPGAITSIRSRTIWRTSSVV